MSISSSPNIEGRVNASKASGRPPSTSPCRWHQVRDFIDCWIHRSVASTIQTPGLNFYRESPLVNNIFATTDWCVTAMRMGEISRPHDNGSLSSVLSKVAGAEIRFRHLWLTSFKYSIPTTMRWVAEPPHGPQSACHT